MTEPHSTPDPPDARRVALVVLATIAVGVLAVSIAALRLTATRARAGAAREWLPAQVAPGRALSGEIGREIGPTAPFPGADGARRLGDEQRRALGSFGWVDRDAGVAHIPIDLALRWSLEPASGAGGAPGD